MYYQRSRRGRNTSNNNRDNSRSRARTQSVDLNPQKTEKRLSSAEIDQVLQDIRSRDPRSRSNSRPPPPKGTPPPLGPDADQILQGLRSRSSSRPPPPKAQWFQRAKICL